MIEMLVSAKHAEKVYDIVEEIMSEMTVSKTVKLTLIFQVIRSFIWGRTSAIEEQKPRTINDEVVELARKHSQDIQS